MHYFASQLRAEHDTAPSLRASQYSKTRKAGLRDALDESSLSPAPAAATHSSSRVQSHASLAPPASAQLRVAGLLPGDDDDDDEIPPAPFPHAPARASKGHYGFAEIQQEMAKTPSSLYAVNAKPRGNAVDGRPDTNSSRRTHLHNVSALMHRSLLVGDYERAGKAWGIILRTQVAGGNPVDPRNHGRWGIGAEILLRRTSQSTTPNDQPPTNGRHEHGIFSEEGFELAREYYERMIVQHPSRRTHPHIVDERTFYPAMFSLWIYEVTEKSRCAKRKIRDKRQASPSQGSTSPEIEHVDDKSTLAAKEDAIKVDELARALEIAERIDRLIASPPFDKQTSLLQLRGHVCLWISDLVMGQTMLDADWDVDTSIESEFDSRSALDQLTRLKNGQRELLQAQSLFERARNSGAPRAVATTSNIRIRVNEVARHIEKLQSSYQEPY